MQSLLRDRNEIKLNGGWFFDKSPDGRPKHEFETSNLGQQRWQTLIGAPSVKFRDFNDVSIKSNISMDSIRRAEAVEYNNKGHKKYLQVDFDDAIEDYSRAIELDPVLAVAYFNRGTVLYRLGHYDLALKDLLKCVELEPSNRDFAEGLSECRKKCR